MSEKKSHDRQLNESPPATIKPRSFLTQSAPLKVATDIEVAPPAGTRTRAVEWLNNLCCKLRNLSNGDGDPFQPEGDIHSDSPPVARPPLIPTPPVNSYMPMNPNTHARMPYTHSHPTYGLHSRRLDSDWYLGEKLRNMSHLDGDPLHSEADVHSDSPPVARPPLIPTPPVNSYMPMNPNTHARMPYTHSHPTYGLHSRRLVGDSYLGEPDPLQHSTAPQNVTANPQGTVSLKLCYDIKVDVSLDNAVRVINHKSKIVVAVNTTGSRAALLHPTGRIFQYGPRIDVVINDSFHNNCKFAKITHGGVVFSSDRSALVYLMDIAGLRSTSDTFTNLSYDFSLDVFYKESRYGPQNVREAIAMAQGTKYSISPDGSHNYLINNMKISQGADGTVSIYRDWNRNIVRTSCVNGTASISSPFFHCTASLGKTAHIFVRRGEKRLHYSCGSFAVRNGPYSAGFDNRDVFRLY